MKIILSRKGFDSSSAGGWPSPIFPHGSFCSLPIRSRREHLRMSDIRWRKRDLGSIVKELTGKQFGGVHLDPDLRRESIPRKPGWLPMFGQEGPAQKHLENENVCFGDIFLFFGWFRQTKWDKETDTLIYLPKSPKMHVIFGWLQVDRIWKPSRMTHVPSWAQKHPHIEHAHVHDKRSNTVYVAPPWLHLPGLRKKMRGGGVFRKQVEALRLTADGEKRCSFWRLPKWFYPSRGRPPLTYHSEKGRWGKPDSKWVMLETVRRGQEFVLDCDYYPEAIGWLKDIFANVRA